jgi:hypothetical protein
MSKMPVFCKNACVFHVAGLVFIQSCVTLIKDNSKLENYQW